jgi:hypothetical protein
LCLAAFVVRTSGWRWSISNKEALYNFLSTFSGTLYVTPRAITATIGFHF